MRRVGGGGGNCGSLVFIHVHGIIGCWNNHIRYIHREIYAFTHFYKKKKVVCTCRDRGPERQRKFGQLGSVAPLLSN